MAHTIHKPKETVADQALLTAVLATKSYSKTGGEHTIMASSFPYRKVDLHTTNDLSTLNSDESLKPVMDDGSVDILGYSKGTAEHIKPPIDSFLSQIETSNSYKSPLNYTNAHHSTFDINASKNLSNTFQLTTLGELQKHSDKFGLGNNFGSTRLDALELQDHVRILESNNLFTDDGQRIHDDKRFSRSQPISEDVEMLQKQVKILQQNCEHTMQQLLQKEEENSKLKSEVTKHCDTELRLNRECDRLRTHLLETEDRYTREALEAEEREEQLRKSMAVLREQMISSNADVVNAKSSAVKQVESLRSQLNSVMEERDAALQRLADAEETISSYYSSLANLQMVLEQFQDERQSHQMVELEKCRQDLEKERLVSQQLYEKLDGVQAKVDELSSAVVTVKQLEQQLAENEGQMADLRQEVQAQETELKQTKANLQRYSAVSEDKIDRPLVKNLLMGFIHTPPAKRSEAFRVVGHILGFTDDELKEIGVNTSGSWVSGLFHRNTSLPINLGSHGRSTTMDHSFFELFVQFLEKESSPLPRAKLPTERMVQEQEEKLHRSSSPSLDGPSTPPPLSAPLSNPFSTSSHSKSMQVFQVQSPAYPDSGLTEHDMAATATCCTETHRTAIPNDPSASGSDYTGLKQ